MFSDLKAPFNFLMKIINSSHCVHKKINFIFHSRNSLEAKSWKMTNYEMTNLLKNLHNKLSMPLGFRHATKMMPNYRVIYMSEAMIKFYCVHRNFFCCFFLPSHPLTFSYRSIRWKRILSPKRKWELFMMEEISRCS